jgi:hypothetical protein
MLQTWYALSSLQICRRSALLLSLFCFFVFNAYGQHETTSFEHQAIQDLIESISPDLPEDYDFSDLLESLTYLHKHPINLNKTNPESLKALVFLSPLQISNLFRHIKANGKLLDLVELQSIDAFDVLTVQRLMPFVKISEYDKEQHGFPSKIGQSEQQLTLRYGQVMEKQKGFNDLPGSRYLGSPQRLLAKYKYNYKDEISASLVIEKDAGEYLFSGDRQKGFDFMSGNISLRNLGMVRKLVIGDYSLQFGQA